MPASDLPDAERLQRSRNRALLTVLAVDVAFLGLCFVLFRREPVLLGVIVVAVVVFSGVLVRRILLDARTGTSPEE